MEQRIQVAFAVPGGTSYARNVVRGAHSYAVERGGVEIHLCLELNQAGELGRLRQLVRNGHVHGFIAEIWYRPLLALTKLGVPVVEISGSWSPEGLTTVHTDDAAVGRLVAEYLLGKGLRNFACANYSAFLHARQRLAAFQQTVQKAGYPCSIHEREHGRRIEVSPETNRLRAWLRSLPKPVGLMAWFDNTACEITYACRLEGIRIPEEVVLVGVGNDSISCETADPTVSSVDLCPDQIGRRSMQVLLELIRKERQVGEAIILPPGKIIERQSSQGLAVENAEVASAIRYIEEHLHQPLEVREVLQHVSLSRRALEAHFLRLFGRTPRDHIRCLQMERAKDLLAKSNVSVKEIASRSGFSGPTAFCSTFRRLYKMTPGDYRNREMAGRTAKPTSRPWPEVS